MHIYIYVCACRMEMLTGYTYMNMHVYFFTLTGYMCVTHINTAFQQGAKHRLGVESHTHTHTHTKREPSTD